MKLLGVLLLLTFVCHVTGKNCIKGGGNKKCTKGKSDCDDGLVCMDTKPGNADSLCGAPQAEGCWCDPSLTSVEACKEGYSCQEQHNGKFECECDSSQVTPDQCPDNGWSLTYHHDKNGNPLSGSIDNLIDLVNQGVQVKVFNEPFGFISVQHLTVSYETEYSCPDGCVHGQALFYAPVYSPRPIVNTYLVFSTTGNTHITEFPANSPINEIRQNSNGGFEMKWYTRNNSRPVTSESQLKRYIQDGASVQALAFPNSFSIPLDFVSSTAPITGWSIHKLADIFGGTEFNTFEQTELSMWSYDGGVEKARWFLNVHTLAGTEQLQGQTLNWAVDPCWRMVYRHNGAGERLSGSKVDLVAAVENGKGLRLKVEDKYYTARTIRQLAGTDKIIAQVYDSINSDVTVGQWKWLDVSNTGLVKTVTFNIGDNQLLSENWENREVTWYAENKVWTLATEPTGSDITAQIENGADVRYRVNTPTGIISYLADYAQKEFVIPRAVPITIPVFALYNDREIVYNGTDYLNRKSLVNWDTRLYKYHDYKVGDKNRIEYTEVPSNEANIQFFYSQVNV